MGKKLLDFVDIDLIFQGHTSTLNVKFWGKKRLSAPYLLNQMMDSGQTLCIASLG